MSRKARPGDMLIAQYCMDHGLKLLTRDHDFQAFSEAAELAAEIWPPGPRAN